jgi:hypothetical protein
VLWVKRTSQRKCGGWNDSQSAQTQLEHTALAYGRKCLRNSLPHSLGETSYHGEKKGEDEWLTSENDSEHERAEHCRVPGCYIKCPNVHTFVHASRVVAE